MKSALVAVLVLSASAFTARTASADVYLGLGVGARPAVNDSLASFGDPDSRSLRALGGYRYASFAIEAALDGFRLADNRGRSPTMYQGSIAAKLGLPLGNGFEVFGRVGLERTWFDIDDSTSWQGDGYLAGGGFEYRFKLATTSTSLFVDYTVHQATLVNARQEADVSSRMWALGFTIGL